MTTIVHQWSGPRSLSTAMMYSFAQRPDCQVEDEPLYANHLRTFASLHRPYRAQLLETFPENGNDALRRVYAKQVKPLLFIKNIAKQFTDCIDTSLLIGAHIKHIILIRDPVEIISGWGNRSAIHQEVINNDITNLPELVNIFTTIRSATGKPPLVINVSMLHTHPKIVLQALCAALGVPFHEEQLSWPAGPKPDIDGLWAPFWYQSVHKSTGFMSAIEKAEMQALTSEQWAVYHESLPYYEFLNHFSLAADPLHPHKTIVASDAPRPPIDSRNSDLLVYVGDRLLPRRYAKVSVFDSAVQGGDAVWEGLRVYSGRVLCLEEHLNRLQDSARAMAFADIPSNEVITKAVFRTLIANNIRDGAHMRLTLTRGPKISSSMNPKFNCFGCTLLIVPEYKPVGDATTYNNDRGIKLITAANRRNPPQCVDSKIHHCNLINNILPKIQANAAGAADALMLDMDGFVAETNATNVFLVKRGVVYTPLPDACLPGITRDKVMQLLRTQTDITCTECRLSLAEFHSADEVFTTGTMGEITPVREIDGRAIGSGVRGPVTEFVQELYRRFTETNGVPIPF